MIKQLYFILILISLISLATFPLQAQKSVLYPKETNTLWYNLEEWIFNNSNIPFRTYDFGSYDTYASGHNFGVHSDFSITIDGLSYNSQWLNNDFLTLPNISFSDIDSVVINFDEHKKTFTSKASYSIEVFTKKSINFASLETGRLNQINDPGMLWNDSPNVEFINFPTNAAINIEKNRYRSFFSFTAELYSRTGQLGYDKVINRTLLNRTEPPSDGSSFEAQRNQQLNLLWIQSLTYQQHKISLLAAAYNSNQFYEWHKLSGIEAPYSLSQYQFSASLDAKKNSIYKGTSLNFSTSESDTLDYESPAALALSELTFSQATKFEIPFNSTPFKLSLQSKYYQVTDKLTKSSYDHHSYSIAVSRTLKNRLRINTVLGNDIQSIALNKLISNSSSIQLSSTRQFIGNSSYNYSYYNRGIGFSNLESSSHRVTNNSDLNEIYSQIKWTKNHKNSRHNFNGSAFIRHYWKLPTELIEYTSNNNSLQLNTHLLYSDSKNNGLFSVQTYLRSQITKTIKLRTMLRGSLSLYGNDLFKDHRKSIPNFVFSESIQFIPDKNFILELFYKYIPARSIYEYKNLENSPSGPPVRIQPISMLNFSSTMWFVNRTLELKFTLRNLLDSTESYDTNGMYYSMSIYISGKINFQF